MNLSNFAKMHVIQANCVGCHTHKNGGSEVTG